jgi:hypothetical protein
MINTLVPESVAVDGFCCFRALFEVSILYLTCMKLLGIMYI